MHECLKTPPGAKRTLCPLDSLLPRLGDKWTIHVMALLSEARGNQLRFSELKNRIEGISQKMLTGTGKGMLPAMTDFMDWMQSNWVIIQTARAEYDRQRA